MANMCDYSSARPGGAALVSFGIKGVIRYLWSNTSSKGIGPNELDDLVVNGIKVAVVYEEDGEELTVAGGGLRVARIADGLRQALGYPNAPVHFAVDFDPNDEQLAQIVAEVASMDEILPFEERGVYGNYDVIETVVGGGHAKYGWQTYAWSQGKVSSHATLYQYLNGQSINGGAVDYDRNLAEDFGAIDGSTLPASTADDPMIGEALSVKVYQSDLQELGYDLGPAGVDGDKGPATTAAVKKFQTDNGLGVDGIVGPLTAQALKTALAIKRGTSPTPVQDNMPGATDPVSHADPVPAYPLPAGYYFGPKAGPVESVSGYFSHRDDLRTWQQRMRNRGWQITVDGLYGPNTASVTRAFQAQKGLTVDGLIGPNTWAAAWTAPVTP